MMLFKLILKNLYRNRMRSILTSLSIFFLVAILTLVGTVLRFLEDSMAEKEKDIKLIITERSDQDNFSLRYMEDIIRADTQLNTMLRNIKGFDPDVFATWNFVAFTLDKQKIEKDTFLISVATQPDNMLRMTDGLEDFGNARQIVEWMKHPPVSGHENIGIIMGPERLKKLNKKVGDIFTAYVLDPDPTVQQAYEFEVVGVLPATSRWTSFCFMDVEYLRRKLQSIKHPQAGKVDLGWLMVQSQEAATQVAHTISTYLPQVKCETLASAMGRFLESYKDLLFGIKYILVPAIYFVMTLIVANAISITVRERRKELAVLKVLGFSGNQILILVLGEGLLLGVLAGTVGSWSMYAIINLWMEGINIPIGFFPLFFVPQEVALVGAGLRPYRSLGRMCDARFQCPNGEGC
ncbi:MAG: ABC transporter permease [Gemmatales bacterium]